MNSSHPTGQRAAGFTLVEVLAALAFLAFVIPAIVQGLTLSNRAGVIAERSGLAGEFAQNKMSELLTGDAWSNAPNTSGDFGAGASGYHWKMSTDNWPADSSNPMTELAVDVSYQVQGQSFNVHLSTLVSQPSASPSASPSPSASS
jgi:prepilin-type N-terminal cleavage/methylation domain-containing protein